MTVNSGPAHSHRISVPLLCCAVVSPGNPSQMMPKAAQVTLCYWPYESNGAVHHRSFRLQGQGALRSNCLCSCSKSEQASLHPGRRWSWWSTGWSSSLKDKTSSNLVSAWDLGEIQHPLIHFLFFFFKSFKVGPSLQRGCHCCGECFLMN